MNLKPQRSAPMFSKKTAVADFMRYHKMMEFEETRLDGRSAACVGKFEGSGTIKSRQSSSMMIARRHTTPSMPWFVPIRLG
jgi:hypothetical protein